MMKEGEIDTRREGVVVVLASGGQPKRAESRHPVFEGHQVNIKSITFIES